MTIKEYLTSYILLHEIRITVNLGDKKSVNRGNKAMGEMTDILHKISNEQGGKEALDTLLNNGNKGIKYFTAMHIMNVIEPIGEMQEKCISLIKEDIEKGDNFAYEIWLKNWEERKK